MQIFYVDEQMCLFGPDSWSGKTSPEPSAAEHPKVKISALSRKKLYELKFVTFQSLDLTPGAGNLWGEPYWEEISPLLGDALMLNTGVSPREEKESSLSQILQDDPPIKYYLSPKACLGILRRADERGKELPEPLDWALGIQSGFIQPDGRATELKAYHINQRDEGIDLHGVSGALMATANMQMQTFVTQPGDSADERFGQQPLAFAANQRDEVRDLHDIAGALGAQPGMKQQTFIAQNCLTPWDTQQKRVFTPKGKAPTLAGADGGGGRSPGGLLLSAGFLPESSSTAGDIGYQAERAPTLKAGGKSSAVLCLNDQGGKVMECSKNVSGTLRAQEHGHQPLVYENHGIDSRYTGPHKVAPTMSARYGTGGNNVPLVEQAVLFNNHGQDVRYNGPADIAQPVTASFGMGGNNTPLVEQKPVFCITGNAIDRQPQNGGNGIGYQEDIAYTLTATDHHAVFSRQRVDVFKDDNVVSTQSARQHKDATDLVMEERSQGPYPLLIRRLTPLECERLQGFPDGWTDIPNASDSARYKALGNSVAIPCVDYVLFGIALVLKYPKAKFRIEF